MLQIEKLPQSFPIHFCPENLNFRYWEEMEPFFQSLLQRQISGQKEFLQWIEDWNELASILKESEDRLFLHTACQTDNEDYRRQYLEYQENVKPKLEPYWHKVHLKYLEHRQRIALPSRYDFFHRHIENQVKLWRQENIALQVEEVRLCQKYNELTGAMTVEYRGQERTLSQLTLLLEEPDRQVREEAWRLIWQRRSQDRERLDELFDRLFQLRVKMARNAGYEDFISFSFARLERFDYTPQDCQELHKAVEKIVVPVVHRLQKRRQKALGVETLRPWDLSVDPWGEVPLRPFRDVRELVEKAFLVLQRLDPEFGERFREMEQLGLLDLDNRKAKAPGGFQYDLEAHRYPFIFMNAVGSHEDVITLFHEFGHALNYFASRQESILYYRHPPIEFAEVASMAMELLSSEHWNVFYKPPVLTRARKVHLIDIVKFLPWFAAIDYFQHLLYCHPNHTVRDREAFWLETMERFGGVEDWSGLEEFRKFSWQRQLHLFEVPLYYIEYAFAQLGALQIWLNAKKDPKKALSQYKYALSLGGTCSLKELYEAAGAKFVFSEREIASILEAVLVEIEALEKLYRDEMRSGACGNGDVGKVELE
ncbi:MAG: M3 family oligoendopeptidase [Planctomycetota bacterium]|nr:MAG: M3 family oligoendopeptidase [Planctomycetota bacterium]